ncbi:hypothetical protein GTO27_01285 [Candidatus Bathyarchaeota archaeon]|nr:hypothetical protein [Candidatus Bathyarchaeota archaeon]
MRKILAAVAIFFLLLSTFSILAVTTKAATEEQIEEAIALGLEWLADEQNPDDGYWGESPEGYRVSKTALAVLKFETHAIQNDIDPLDPSYYYYDQVRNGLDYIFSNAWTISIGMQTHGNPDTRVNGLGVGFGTRRTYDTGIAMMAIAASTHPEMEVDVSGSAVDDWTYKEVVQDAVDYLAWGQTDGGVGRGGWNYAEMNNMEGRSDNSNSGYAVLGLAYAEANTIDGATGFGCSVPSFVKSELSFWIDWIQNDVDGDTNDGGSGYDERGDDYWVNTLKTGNLLFEMAFYGDDTTVQRVTDAVDYIDRHWNDPDYIGWKGPGPGGDPSWPACYQTMYCIMKGFEALGIDYISPLNDPSGIDWFDEFADALILQQNVDGSWPNAPFFGAPDGQPWSWDTDQILSTVWAMLTLQKAVVRPIISVYVDIKPGSWPNPINKFSQGRFAVAICGTEDFDVATIDPVSVKLKIEGVEEGVSPLRWSYDDVATPYTGEPGGGHELDGDGYLDLVLFFDTQEAVSDLELCEFEDGEVITLIVAGNLHEEFGGTPIRGHDYVRIQMPKGKGPGLKGSPV